MTWEMGTQKASPPFHLTSLLVWNVSHVQPRCDSCRGTNPNPGPAWTRATYFSFSISMESLFMSVSLKSKDRLSLMRLKLGRSVGSAGVLEFMDCWTETETEEKLIAFGCTSVPTANVL